MQVSPGDKIVPDTLKVLEGTGPNLCGRDLLRYFYLLPTPAFVNQCQGDGNSDAGVSPILAKFSDLFEPSLGLLKGPPSQLQLREGGIPKFYKARPLTYALRKQV